MILGVAVEKAVTWREKEELFTNVWHYDASVDTSAESVADAVVGSERALFGANVTFKNVKVWGPADGTPLQSQMLVQKTLTGPGTATSGEIMAKEMAAVIAWDTGRLNTRGGRIYLRKYLHLGRGPSTDPEAAKGNTAMTAAEQTRLRDFGNSMKNLVGVAGANICDKKGRKLPLNTGATVLPHLHTRQFRR
jgi:hypothetical protein